MSVKNVSLNTKQIYNRLVKLLGIKFLCMFIHQSRFDKNFIQSKITKPFGKVTWYKIFACDYSPGTL